jgi:hypothetical protein
VGQLVVRAAADDPGTVSPECGHGVVVDGTAEGARRVDIKRSWQQLGPARRDGDAGVLRPHALGGGMPLVS